MSSKKNLLFFLFLIPFLAKSQINLTIGYDLGIKKHQEINAALARYNAENSLSKKMNPVWNMNGLDMGLSYKLDFLTLEGHYITRFKTIGAKETTPTEILKKYTKINDQSFSFGGLVNFAKFGVGAAWQQHSYQFSRKFSDDKRFVDAFSSKLHYSTLNLFLDFHFKMNKQLGFHVRPYYDLPLRGDNINQSAVDNVLLLTPKTVDNPNTKWGYWGIKFLFFNGRQEE